ncbi:hypothetical protein GCM10009127_03990 [Alteraurantiacibacter aestuarii]|uniref:Uncharacterized protein n=1 Tax=Alteraurantiacibacter aestuarii TaxID=650004 RepID=A0A844ZRW7_9SPHN|nr:hypothetical protein [Alteraurantiacibacter aestuarii]MXO88349.1 hypothetical protein [Alteraurantiacibacter aestuarii]
MAFQPFGDHFEVASHMPVDAVKAAIRANKKSWFDPKRGARGWIVGPFLCLWISALDKNGPMVLARISVDGFGTRISGRAGSDLNGLIGMTFMACLMAAIPLIAHWRADTLAPVFYLALALVFFSVGLSFWFANKSRRDAEPLIRFLRRTVNPAAKVPKPPKSSVAFPAQTAVPMHLDFSGEEVFDNVSPNAVRDMLCRIAEDEDGFAILSFDDGHYLQTAWADDGFVLEKREGSEDLHFIAVRAGDPQPARGRGSSLSLAEIETAFAAYCEQVPITDALGWQPLFR